MFMAVTFSPLMMISPDVGSTSRRRQRMSVDFPLPESPMMMNVSPQLISGNILHGDHCVFALVQFFYKFIVLDVEEETLIPFFLV